MFKTVIRWHNLKLKPEHLEKEVPLVQYAGGRKMLLVKTDKGIFAIEEKCPHNGFSLARGTCTVDGEAIICPLHRYAFYFSTGRSRNGGGGAARVFPVEIREGIVFVGTEETQWGW
jgi:nitrite reductase/ring-hydroxylating ferredoxin subunit